MSSSLSTCLAAAVAGRRRKQQGRGSGKGPPPGAKAKKTGLFTRLADLYARMEEAYQRCAAAAGLTCAGCRTNCCTSFFRHHTYVEWAYLWRGLSELPEKRRKEFTDRAKAYLEEARGSLAAGTTPTAMCPLNENGLCALYAHRLMICRMHGTRNSFTLPDGRRQFFPGCARFTALPCAQTPLPREKRTDEAAPDAITDERECPTLDRTPFYSELAALEMEFGQKAAHPLPRVDLTLAEMIVMGPPRLK